VQSVLFFFQFLYSSYNFVVEIYNKLNYMLCFKFLHYVQYADALHI